MNTQYEIYSNPTVFRVVVETSPVGIVISDDEGVIRLVNERAQRMFGYGRDELIGRSLELLVPLSIQTGHFHGWTGQIAHSILPSLADGRVLFARRKEGAEFPVEVSLHAIDLEHRTMILANVLEAAERRMSDAAREERASLERLALVGQLSGGVAHEIRTPLSVIRNDVYFLQSLADQLGPEAKAAMQEINEALDKANRIVNELLDFTREPFSHPTKVAVKTVLRAALKNCGLPSSVELITADSLDELVMYSDAEQVERILINLLRNAVQAMDGKGRIEIAGGVDQQSIWIEIADSGPGIASSDRDRVFDPLFTTKSTGVGLGLAISHRYAQLNHGDLIVCDRPFGGACFRLSLPSISPPMDAAHHE